MRNVSETRAMAPVPRSVRWGAVAVGLLWLWPARPAVAQQAGGGPALAVLTMDQAVQLALARNQLLRAQRLDVDAAKADQVTASLKPNVTFASVNENFPAFSPRQFTWDFAKNNANYVESLGYLFELGGKRKNRMLVASDSTDVTTRTVTDAERQVRFQTAQAFIDVLLAKSTLDLAQQNLTSFSDVVDISRQRLAAGDMSQNDFDRISLQKLQFEQDASAAQIQLVQTRLTLRQLVGYDTVADDFDVAGDLAYHPASVALDDIRAAALSSRPDLLAAQANVKLAEDAVRLEKSNGTQDLSGEVEYDRAGTANGLGFGVSIDLPIHDRNQGNIAHAQVASRQAVENAAAARIAVLADVDNAYATLQADAKIVGLFQSGYLDQAQESLDISRYVYQRGAGSLLDLLDAERTYRDTQIAFRQAVAAYMTGVEQVNFAAGRQVVP